MSCVVADENISEYSSLPDDIEVMEENSGIEDVELYGGSHDTSESDQSELNTTGIVMSDDEYSCGQASFLNVILR